QQQRDDDRGERGPRHPMLPSASLELGFPQLPFLLAGGRLQIPFQVLEVFDLRVHRYSVSASASASPRSCSTSPSCRRPRLTRWRALASLHSSFLATSGYPRSFSTRSWSASRWVCGSPTSASLS